MGGTTVKVTEWILSIVVVFILLQTLYFKFTAHPESVYIFSTLGMEPYGRIGTGVAELMAGALLLIPRVRVYGAALGFCIISGALFFHFTALGIEVRGDGGQLFGYALVVWASCLAVLVMRWRGQPVRKWL